MPKRRVCNRYFLCVKRRQHGIHWCHRRFGRDVDRVHTELLAVRARTPQDVKALKNPCDPSARATPSPQQPDRGVPRALLVLPTRYSTKALTNGDHVTDGKLFHEQRRHKELHSARHHLERKRLHGNRWPSFLDVQWEADRPFGANSTHDDPNPRRDALGDTAGTEAHPAGRTIRACRRKSPSPLRTLRLTERSRARRSASCRRGPRVSAC